ncbi:FAD-dependent oxidoreductase [Gordonia sp. NPDC127522]|uniref:FAD-dependent oxidoreductase n=1 Tax=Gordonia sp. NPDC127522 TaxID=3345390 RepID=UPI003637F2EB
MHDQGFDEVADVVVIGLGAAGAAAAISARTEGARVLVVEKCPSEIAGGNTRVTGGGWFINSDPDRAKTYLRSLCGVRRVPDDVVTTWASETAMNSRWLRDIGADVKPNPHFHATPEFYEHEGSDCYGGMDTIGGELGNGRLHQFLTSAVNRAQIDVWYESPATDLILDGDRSVVGVEVASRGELIRIRARGGVVLATGGFAANDTMVHDFLGVEGHVLWGSPHNTGDGHHLAMRAGADLWHMDNMMSITGIDVGDKTGLLLYPALANNFVFLGRDGRRFMDESLPNRHGHVSRNGQEELFPKSPFFMVFDEEFRNAGAVAPGLDTMQVGWKLLMERHQWSPDNSAEIERGLIVRAESIEELAPSLGIDAATLVTSIAMYNNACDARRDDHFGRRSDSLGAVRTPPFYALTVSPLLGWSDGGPRRDGRARVVDTRGEVISGLYAAGELSATYSWNKDGGFHIADALAFGRVAGREAASAAEDFAAEDGKPALASAGGAHRTTV